MIAQTNFLVVVDPAHDDHVALNRVLAFARRQRHQTMQAHIIVGFEGQDYTDPNTPNEVRQPRGWFTELLRPLQETGVDFTAELLWTQDWRSSILEACDKYECDMIVISELSAEHKKGGITDSRWAMLREANVPVMTIEPGAPDKREVILAAVNVQTSAKKHTELNQKVLDQASATAEFYEADLHVVNAYQSSEDYPDRDHIHRMIDVDRQNIHVDMGPPGQVIDEVVRKIGADLVILGTTSKKGLRAAFRRNISEIVIETLLIDVLTVN